MVGESSSERGLGFGSPKSRATGLGPTDRVGEPVNLSALSNSTPTMKTIKFVGLDVHAETVAVGVAVHGEEVRSYGIIEAHTHAIDRLHQRLSGPGIEVRYVYEAGPTGFALCRHLRARGLVCEVVSPSLVPKPASQRIKTDRRDASTLARLFRAGELSFIRVPDEADEAIRDLVRARLAAVEDLRRSRQRIKAFLLRHGRRYSGKSSWTAAHLNYLSKQVFGFPAQQLAFEEQVRAADEPAARLERLTTAIEEQVQGWSRLPLVKAFMCLRGMALINAVTCVCEIGDFLRFDHPRKLMGYLGLVPSEDSSGTRRRQGGITKTGNEACRRALVEAAWHYRLAAKVSPTIRQRQHDQPRAVVELAWKAQVRLCGRYRALSRRLKRPVVAVTAVARELAAFLWAIARVVDGRQLPARRTDSPPESRPIAEPPQKPGPKTRTYALDPGRKQSRRPKA